MNENKNIIPSPCYVLEEKLLRKNLQLITDVSRRADVEVILAFKAFALWKSFPIFREYIHSTTASSPYEARLGYEEFGSRTHTYSPAYTEEDFDEIIRCSSHITFNSLSQYNCFYPLTKGHDISCGLRINPEYSEVKTMLYNPCSPGTRFGITADKLPDKLPEGIEGFHCHTLCESSDEVFERTLAHIEEKFGKWFEQLKWINFGGGHLMTHKDYNIEHLIEILNKFHKRHPHLKVILEPGSAFLWQTGYLTSKVVDIVEDKSIKTAILNISFTCHMPDCLEMPYQPDVRGAASDESKPYNYRLGGNSCLSGDYIGTWSFDHSLQIGEEIIFEDMIHYTTVKTNMFNGIAHPSIGILHTDGHFELYRKFTYEDYKDRMD
jgi:carboxynorspermidine decarboxylase